MKTSPLYFRPHTLREMQTVSSSVSPLNGLPDVTGSSWHSVRDSGPTSIGAGRINHEGGNEDIAVPCPRHSVNNNRRLPQPTSEIGVIFGCDNGINNLANNKDTGTPSDHHHLERHNNHLQLAAEVPLPGMSQLTSRLCATRSTFGKPETRTSKRNTTKNTTVSDASWVYTANSYQRGTCRYRQSEKITLGIPAKTYRSWGRCPRVLGTAPLVEHVLVQTALAPTLSQWVPANLPS